MSKSLGSGAEASARLRVEDVNAFGPHSHRDYITGPDDLLGGSDCNKTVSAGERDINDLLVSHRLDDCNLAARPPFAIAKHFDVLRTHSEKHAT
jgi:hypothetical protein